MTDTPDVTDEEAAQIILSIERAAFLRGRVAGMREAADRFRVASLVALLTQEQADEIEQYIRAVADRLEKGEA